MTEGGPAHPLGGAMRGVAWMVAMRWAIRLIGLVNTAIIARLLAPESFGRMAMAMIFVDLATALFDGDVEMALVRADRLDEELLATGWSLKIAAGAIIFALLWLVGPIVAGHLEDPSLTLLIRVAALRPLLQGFENIAVVEFRRSLDFKREFLYLVSQRLLNFVIGLILVFSLRSTMALALAGPTAAVSVLLLSYLMAPARPRLGFRRWRTLWAFSRWQILFNASRLLAERADPFIITRWVGATATGLYAVGFDLALTPCREIMLPAGRALMPNYVRLRDDPAALRSAFEESLAIALAVGCAAGLGLASVAEPAVSCLLGPQWRDCAPLVTWLAGYGVLEGLWLMLDPLLIASGRERRLALANAALALMMAAGVALTIGRAGIAWVPFCRMAILSAALAAIFLVMLSDRLISLPGLVRAAWRPLLASAAMIAAVALAEDSGALPPLAALLRDMAAGGFSYLVVLFGAWRLCGSPPGAERLLLSLLRPARPTMLS